MAQRLSLGNITGQSSRESMDSEQISWSSNRPLVTEGEKDVETLTRYVTKRRTWSLWPLIFHALLFSAYSVFFLTTPRTCGKGNAALAYSPATSAISLQKVRYDGGLHALNPFRGTPGPKLDEAWHNLLENSNIRISKEELENMNKTAIQLHDGSGYYGTLSAYHHLHCLKFLRQVLHPDYYHINAPDKQEHVDHCVDDIRQALMCHADTSVVTHEWKGPEWRRPSPNFLIDHTCVDWQVLDGWASERSFSLFDQKSIVHPELGLAYPMIDGKIEDISHGPGMHVVWPSV